MHPPSQAALCHSLTQSLACCIVPNHNRLARRCRQLLQRAAMKASKVSSRPPRVSPLCAARCLLLSQASPPCHLSTAPPPAPPAPELVTAQSTSLHVRWEAPQLPPSCSKVTAYEVPCALLGTVCNLSSPITVCVCVACTFSCNLGASLRYLGTRQPATWVGQRQMPRWSPVMPSRRQQ